jgi:tetratricopeptide (TPR) repeat protein
MVQNPRQLSFLRAALAAGVILAIAFFVIYFPLIRQDAVSSQQPTKSVDEYRRDALKAEADKDLPQAIWNFRQVLDLQRDDRTALERLPKLYLQSGQPDQVLEFAKKLTDLDSQSPDGFFYLGMAYAMMGQKDIARENFQKALRIDPKFAPAHFNLGFLSESDGRLAEAIDYYKKALDADPKHAQAAYNLGNAYAGLEQNQDAIAAYKKAVENDPHYTDAFVNLSILLTKTGNYEEAIKYLDEARLLGYEAPEAYLKTLEPYRK